MSGWDYADGVGAGGFQCFSHVAGFSRDVFDDDGAEFLEFFAFRRGGVEGETGDGFKVSGEVVVSKEELGDEVACLAVDGGDAEVSRHDCVVLGSLR